MNYRNSCLVIKLFVCVSVLFVLSIPAQTDPNPNSPVPQLVSRPGANRVLAKPTDSGNRPSSRRISQDVFDLNQKINLYVRNVELLKGEDARAFRLFATDAKGRVFRFPVLRLHPVKHSGEMVYELTVLLRSDAGYRGQPTADGDLMIYLTWRGLKSNSLRLGLGKTGGAFAAEHRASRGKTLSDETTEYVGYRYSGDRLRFMEQATFGPTVALDRRLRRIGLRIWLAEQFEAPYPNQDDPYPDLPLKSSDPADEVAGCGMFPDRTDERAVCKRDHYSMYLLQNWFFRQAFYGEAQLRHRVTWALNQLWVISGVGTQQSSHMVEYHKVLSRNAFGNYRDLMREMTLNPGMGNYLDMARSTKDNPNENFAREVLQLFTIGLFMLNQDGTRILDEKGEPIPTYTQDTVNDFTKVFTGWTFCNNGNNPQCPHARVGTVNYKDPLRLDESGHNPGAKTLLDYPNAVNRELPAGQSGEPEMEQALDNIFYHPNVAPFVGRFLIQQLVMSDPTPAYVERVATIFADNGVGVRGDLKAVVRAVLLDPEARGDVKTAPNYGKLREPVLLITNIARHFDVRSEDGTTMSDGKVDGMTETIGQSVFYSPTVFNYYVPDYVIAGTALIAPEFAIMNTETAVNRYNQVNLLVFENLPGGTLDTPLGTSLDLGEMEGLSRSDATGQLLVETLSLRMLHGILEDDMRKSILAAVLAVPETNHRLRAQNAIYLMAASMQYQIQR